MSTARHCHSCTAFGSKIFVFGGLDSNDEILDSVEVYDSEYHSKVLSRVKKERNQWVCFVDKSIIWTKVLRSVENPVSELKRAN